MTTPTLDTTAPAGAALREVRAAIAGFVEVVRQGGLDHHDAAELVFLLAEAEIARNQLQAADAELIAACRDAGVPERECQRSMAKVLERRFLIGPHEASRRVRAAEATGLRKSMSGLPLPRVRPVIAEAMATGAITSEQTMIVNRTLDQLDRAKVDPIKLELVEAELVDRCRRFGPGDLRQLSQRYLDSYDPDGAEPDERRNQDRRSFRMRTLPSGAVTGEFRFTPETAVKVRAVLEPLAHPRLDPVASAGDLRSHEQRLHDAIDEVFARMLRTGDVPECGGIPATVLIATDADTVLTRPRHRSEFPAPVGGPGLDPAAGPTRARRIPEPVDGRCPITSSPTRPARRHGTASDGTVLSTAEILRLTGEAEIYPIVLDQHGIPLELGRTRRIASKHQTIALFARDGGCSFPGCDRPPEWCERHHVIRWIDGGLTELANLTLLCSHHHRNFLDRGWQVKINDQGLPEWTPPRFVDPEQKPMINNRILARIRQHPLIS
ncbi:DUF222 domain-containing protein [Microlunatus sp. GCM10028923]|uniref:HNH endonuclease signature motif containing protein n=1 Tax=Microlunatus sp. GCM10028923 TaxID=3273400 RepID=UPI003621440E